MAADLRACVTRGFLALGSGSFDVVATVSLVRTNQLTRFQKIAEALIVWSVPFIGA